jgi:hypothetical protein
MTTSWFTLLLRVFLVVDVRRDSDDVGRLMTSSLELGFVEELVQFDVFGHFL